MLQKRWTRPFYREYFLVLMPLFFILHGFVRYPESVFWMDAMKLFFVYVVSAVMIAVIGNWVLRSPRKAALYSFTLISFHFIFGSAHDFLKSYFPDTLLVSYTFLLPLVVIILTALFVLLHRSRRTFLRLTLYLNCLFALLILYDISQLVVKKMGQEQALLKELHPCPDCFKPDIYLLVVDGYGGKEQLLNRFGFDNTAFEDSLRSLGFCWVDSSISNYAASNRSMSSLFNMRFLEGESEDFHEDFNQNTFTEYLKSLRYTVRNFSFFKIDDQFPTRELDHFPFGKKLITSHTFLGRVNNDLGYHLALFLKRADEPKGVVGKATPVTKQATGRDSLTLRQLLGEIGKQRTEPRFVYCHFIMPHPPYLFDRNGNKTDSKKPGKDQYTDYLLYTNKTILFAIDQILQKSKTPPIIMLLSDHGFRFNEDEQLTPDRFLNIKSIYLPSKDYSDYYPGLSNVNFLRLFLNQQFRQQLPLLPDSTVF